MLAVELDASIRNLAFHCIEDMGIPKKPYITGNFHLVLDNQRNAARQIADRLGVKLKFSGTRGCSYRHIDMLRFYHERSEDAYMDFSFTKMSWNSLEADDTNSAVLAKVQQLINRLFCFV
ncbi:hypothetical protein NC651_025752 [Populus alba x Populus x berolinensis]|nr:hypothetical protein NC651_025752 [Populus alba x Populus x berolinensis]